MAIGGMILGIIGLVFSIIPGFGAFVSVPCIGVGLPLSGVAFYRARKENASLGVPIAGLATNAVALVVTVGWIILIVVVGVSTGWE